MLLTIFRLNLVLIFYAYQEFCLSFANLLHNDQAVYMAHVTRLCCDVQVLG